MCSQTVFLYKYPYVVAVYKKTYVSDLDFCVVGRLGILLYPYSGIKCDHKLTKPICTEKRPRVYVNLCHRIGECMGCLEETVKQFIEIISSNMGLSPSLNVVASKSIYHNPFNGLHIWCLKSNFNNPGQQLRYVFEFYYINMSNLTTGTNIDRQSQLFKTGLKSMRLPHIIYYGFKTNSGSKISKASFFCIVVRNTLTLGFVKQQNYSTLMLVQPIDEKR